MREAQLNIIGTQLAIQLFHCFDGSIVDTIDGARINNHITYRLLCHIDRMANAAYKIIYVFKK